MYRQRYTAFLFLCLSMLGISQCITQSTWQRPPATKKPVITRHVILNRRITITPTGSTAVQESLKKCVNVYDVTISAKKGKDKPDVTPDILKVEIGDCVRWTLATDSSDTGPASIDLINFLDTQSEATPVNKVANNKTATDVCQNSGRSCLQYISMDYTGQPEKYRYVVHITHENKTKKSDPELQVSCNGCGEE
jgi:hypothetical protein